MRRPRLDPIDRDIVRLAVPALGALLAEPLFLLTDTAFVGHMGAVPLAAVAIAATLLQTIVGLLIFLAYATTPIVGRRLGAGDPRGAVAAGIDGLWLALGLGALLLVVALPTAAHVVGLFGAPPAVAEAAVLYYSISLLGLPAMLLVIAATGLFRGLQDTRTPLVVAVVGFSANAGLNALLVYGLGWGVVGSAAGSVVAQWGMAAVLVALAVRAARRTGAPLRPGLLGVREAARGGGWLFLRTVALRASFIATTAAATALGVVELATMQIALTVFMAAAFALDALAIAGQALIGHGLGASDPRRVRRIATRVTRLGIAGGGLIGVLLAAGGPVLGLVFTSDAAVQRALVAACLLTAAALPLAGYVFALDGVLIGAGDGRYLALGGIAVLAVHLLALGAAVVLAPADPAGGVAALWIALGAGLLGARAVVLGLRMRGDAWLHRAA